MATSLKSRFDYDLFFSFRGSDTRHSFCSHLYQSLDEQGITFFDDSEHIAPGDNIMSSLNNAIARSRIYVPIFSAKYADSVWCLDELGEIMRRTKREEQLVIPIFYGVEEDGVRRQLDLYREVLERHKKLRGFSESKVREWSRALSKADVLDGFSGSEQKLLIEDIVKAISTELAKFDVFLNFRGEDVREDFVKSLYEALVEKGINTFLDSEKLRKGEDFPPALMDAIERSRMYVVIFSESYAESLWCLKELVVILEIKNNKQKPVLPVFCKVEPSEVRGQRQSYGKALTKHEIRYGEGSEGVKKWREALSEAADVMGVPLRVGKEDDWINDVVEEIQRILGEIRHNQD